MDKVSLDAVARLQGLSALSDSAASEIGRELERFQKTLHMMSPIAAFDDQPCDFRAVQLRGQHGK